MIKYTSILFIFFLLTLTAHSQPVTSAQSGDWNTGSTWVGGVAPISSDNVIVASGHTVTVTALVDCAQLTINASGKVTVSGAFKLPGTSWVLDPASTVEYTTVPSAMAYPDYGNLIYGGANFSLANNLNVLGNLTITTATLRGIGTTSGSLTHHVSGNVLLTGTGARISCVNQTAATTASCTWNIDGDVVLSGNNSGNRIVLYESAGPHSGTAIYNINGNINMGTNTQINYKTSSGTNFDVPGTINLKGNFVQNGSISISSGSLSPNLIINFIGTSNQSWSGTGAFSVTIGTVTVSVNNPAGVTLAAPRTFNTGTTLQLTNGILTTDATNLLTISTGTYGGGASASSFVSGPMRYAVASTSPTILTYPIGKLTSYRPVTLTVTQDAVTSTNYTGEVFNSAPASRILPGTLSQVSGVRYFNFTKGTGANVTAATITLNYDSDDAVTDFTSLRIAKDDGAGNWVDLGGVGTANTTGSITSVNNFTAFSDFVLADDLSGGNPLPVEITSFVSKVSGKNIILHWSTASESNNYGFQVERSSDCKLWNTIGEVKGAGVSNTVKNYSFIDNNYVNSKIYYRLKQIDNNGMFAYSSTIEVDNLLPKGYSLNQNYPNPFNPSTLITYSVPTGSMVKLTVYNTVGEIVKIFENGYKEAGIYEVNFNASGLSTGVYFYKLDAGPYSDIKKMILIK